MDRRFRARTATLLFFVACGAAVLGGCEAAQLEQVRNLYRSSDYAAAYQQAEKIVRSTSGPIAREAAYMAGMAACQLQDDAKAQEYLREAARSSNRELAGRAMAQLGLIDHQNGYYDPAVRWFLEAGRRLTGDDRARSYLYAATAQQKLGRWKKATANLKRVKHLTHDASIRQQVTERLAYKAYTLQVGAYKVESNARRAAQNLERRSSQARLGPPRIVPAVHDDLRLFLVQIGRFNDHASAHAARRRITMDVNVVPIVAH